MWNQKVQIVSLKFFSNFAISLINLLPLICKTEYFVKLTFMAPVLHFNLFPDVCGRRGGCEHVCCVLLDLDVPPVVCPHDPVPAVPDQGQGHQHHAPPHRAPQERHLGLLTLGQLPLAREVINKPEFGPY